MTERGGNQRPPSMAINTTTTLDSLGFLWIARSVILVLPHTQNISGRKISGFERKAFTRQNFPDSKVFRFKVPTLDSGFKISGRHDQTRMFSFRIRPLVCKRQNQSGTKTFRIHHESGNISSSVSLSLSLVGAYKLSSRNGDSWMVISNNMCRPLCTPLL